MPRAEARQRRPLHHPPAGRRRASWPTTGWTAPPSPPPCCTTWPRTPSTGLKEIERRFGPEVARLVDGVTKLTRLELQSERTKQAENFRKLVLAMSEDIRVLLVKLADRLHNMRTLHFVPQLAPAASRPRARRWRSYAPLAERIGMEALKTELETAGLPASCTRRPRQTIAARLTFLRGQGADLIEEIERGPAAACCAAHGVAGGRRHGAREVALLHLAEDAEEERGLRAALGHHGLPRHRRGPAPPATRRWARCTPPTAWSPAASRTTSPRRRPTATSPCTPG